MNLVIASVTLRSEALKWVSKFCEISVAGFLTNLMEVKSFYSY